MTIQRLTVALVLITLAGPALAAPSLVSYQGRLLDNGGSPVASATQLRFRLYQGGDDTTYPSTGTLVYNETVTLTPSAAGIFSHMIGSGTAGAGCAEGTCQLTADDFGDGATPVWIEVMVDPDGTVGTGDDDAMLPRTRVGTVGYAFTVDTVDGAAGGTISGNVDVTGNLELGGDVTVDGATINLGVGGIIQKNGGDLRLTAGSGDHFFGFAGTGTNGGNGGFRAYNDGILYLDSGNGYISFRNRTGSGDVETASINASGNLQADGDVNADRFVDQNNSSYIVDPASTSTFWIMHLNDTNLWMNYDGPDATSGLRFYEDGNTAGESLLWDNGQDRFEVSDTLAVSGPVHVGTTGGSDYSFSWFGDKTGGSPSGYMSNADDVFIESNLEVESTVVLSRWLRMGQVEGSQYIYFFDNGLQTSEVFQWDDPNHRFYISDDLHVTGNLSAGGSKPFIQNHPEDETLEIVYTALEGDEVATYTRGSARLSGGVARVRLGETFALVTNPDIGLTASLTPRGQWSQLYVESITSDELVVRAAPGSPQNAAFDYVVMGLRIGHENSPVLRTRRGDSALPPAGKHHAEIEDRPELAGYTALERHRRMAGEAFGVSHVESARAAALREGIGERESRDPTEPEDIEHPGEVPAPEPPTSATLEEAP